MQQLRSVTFVAPVEVSRGTLLAQVTAGREHQVEFDARAQVVRVLTLGAQEPVCIPMTRVQHFVPIDDQFICPECDSAFENASALGGHRRHKHGVKGGGFAEEKE